MLHLGLIVICEEHVVLKFEIQPLSQLKTAGLQLDYYWPLWCLRDKNGFFRSKSGES